MILISEKQYKANLHCHSVLSDGKLTPEQLKNAYKERGYSVLAITDHERPGDHSDLSDDDFVMLTGYEAYIRPGTECRYDHYEREIHINLFNRDPHNTDLICRNEKYIKYVKDENIRREMHSYGSTELREYSVDYINRFVRTAQEDGYICALNHPVWSLEDYSVLFEYKGFFSLEICNFGSFSGGLPEYNAALYNMFLRHGIRIFAHSADDNHNSRPLDSPATDSFGGFTMINTEGGKLDYASVFAALEKGDFYSSMGPEIKRLEISGGKAAVQTSPAARIVMLTGGKKAFSVYPEKQGETVCSAVFDIPRTCPYVRFYVTDEKGRAADTRGYFPDEFDFFADEE